MENEPTVLVAGADQGGRERLERELAPPYRVRTAPAPSAGCTDDDVDLLVLDVRSSETTVGRLLEPLRDGGYDGPVLAVLGDHADDPGDDVDEYLVEPFDSGDLRERVDELIPPAAAGAEATVFEALGDAKARHCCRVLLEEPLCARDLAETTGYSLPTVYRRLDELEEAGLVEARTRIRDGGGNYDVYRTVTTAVRVDIENGFRVDIEREADGPPA